MDTKSALKSLYQVVATQQEILKKMAQMQGVPAQADDSGALTQKLQQALFAKHPELRSAFIEPPTVAHNDAGLVSVFFKYSAAKAGNSAALKAAVAEVCDMVLGKGKYTINATGEF